MNEQNSLALSLLFQRYGKKTHAKSMSFLSDEQKQLIHAYKIQTTDLQPLLHHFKQFVTTIHYSWLTPLFIPLTPTWQSLFASTLTKEQQMGLKIAPLYSLSSPIYTFCLKQLYHLLEGEKHLPFAYLPISRFNSLLHNSKEELVEIIDFLGLYDLAFTLRNVLDQQRIKNISHYLKSKQLHYLKNCLHLREQIKTIPLELNLMQIDPVSLKKKIHERGLLRLAKALSDQDKDFVWYLSHKLDKGRGSILIRESATDSTDKVLNVLQKQTLDVMNFLKKI